ncbi:hypothetical protein PVL29_015250 [Vitis rotundifolia]|uniref:Uncharacterized protein n=1 Tax=Vitis rotundifolia TaxID=103349 RepID=A0AA38ZC19_VITRO|nr:hypothetical protein PVL29_015250 [Vitis rotundifolia]
MESIEVINAEAVAVWNGTIVSTQLISTGHLQNNIIIFCIKSLSILSIHISKSVAEYYLKMRLERGLLPEMRSGERAALASEATLAAAFLTEVERKMDLAAKPAVVVAIAVLS